ncbi:DUF885 domain-containing protein [Microbulbifer sp. MLAF003]|uniref:DUF885 domain-containing protein n=1 Tax=Microbulbifer sp. MLAF003 TaxID=3032582 RepID=UPI0024ADB9D3|nr:DUF885 domain-containing protein [Microbulbifer sp. MLAF003]WHI52774.1 DUF885 domain-containing protein [Microbulbifer sp. MLAF003]
MIKITAKWFGGALLIGVVGVSAFAANAIYFKPWAINVYFERAFIKIQSTSPETLSILRILEQFGFDGHNAHLDDISEKMVQHKLQIVKDELSTLRKYDRSSLNDRQAISYDIFEYYLESMVEGDRWKHHNYPLNQMFGVQNKLPEFLVELHQINSIKEADYYLSRLSEVDRKFSQVLDGLRIREQKKILPPRFVIDRVLKEMQGFIDVPAQENILYTSLEERLSVLETLPDHERTRILDRGKILIETEVYPAYVSLIAYYRELQLKVTGSHGVWALPEGDEFYAYQARVHTTTNLTPDELHDTGLKEVTRIEEEMNTIFASIGLDRGSINYRFSAINNDPRFIYENSDKGREQIIRDYQLIINEINEGIDDYFNLKPTARVEVRRIAEFKEQGAPKAYYMPPAIDGSRGGVFYVNLRDVHETKKFSMRTLAYHEAVPGHHFQEGIAQDLEELPTFLKAVSNTAYSDGWALYTEQLAKEMGFQDDPYDDLGRLQDEMLRAVRLVVDTGIHHKRWGRKEAIEYMVEKTGMARTEVITEVERYFVMPGQAVAYKTGMLKILELREGARQELGNKFDIREFHDVVLTNGAVPLMVLEQLIDQWIVNKKGLES